MYLSPLKAWSRAALFVWNQWRRLIQSLVGAWVWQAPPWSRWLASRTEAAARRIASRSAAHPLAAGACLLASATLAAGGAGAWLWYQRQPKPELARVSITAPGRTRIEEPQAKPDPLVISFDRSAAALASAGRELPTGIALEPAIGGVWRWVDDRTLEFRPAADWPVGEIYRGRFAPAIFGPQIRLASRDFSFSSAPFAARVDQVEWYQNPLNPAIKQGIFEVHFTHPVDTAEFEQHIELRLAGQSEGVLGVGRATTDFTVVYDDLRLNASIHSASLAMPKDPTELRLRITAGLRSARGGNRSPEPLTAALRVPGLYSLSVTGVDPQVVDNEQNEPEQVLMLQLSAASSERDVSRAVSAWVLPTIRPAQGIAPAAGSDDEPHAWYDVAEVTDEVLKKSEPLPLTAIAAEREFVENHGFRFHADVGRYLFVQVEKNLRSFGGYLSPSTERFVVHVPAFPAQLKILSQGSLLSLSGDRKIVAAVRDLPGVRVEIGRVLPEQLQHLVSQSDGDFSKPTFNGSFGPDNLVERFAKTISLGSSAHGRLHYEAIDLGEYLESEGGGKHGLFLLTVRGCDPAADAKRRPPDDNADDVADVGADTAAAGFSDQRLVLVTDLGILAKKSTDGSRDVFVQSIRTGKPVAAATVEIVAKNGATLFSEPTDASGRAHFAALAGLVRERTPLLIQVRNAGDLSFLPLNRADRSLDYSRFDVGGLRNARAESEIGAYLFSDRGVYRPGDTLHVGMIAKAAAWSKSLAGIPLEYALLDARGLTVKRERFNLPAGGFTEMSYVTADTAPTGTYTVNLFIVKDNAAAGLIGSTTVNVQEFAPDRMRVTAHLSAASADGWVSPKDLKAFIDVQNLFGTPADKRRVEATITLAPAFPAFNTLPGYHFYDPQRAKEGYTEKLQDAVTDSSGSAAFDLSLEKFAKATYRVSILARAYEPDGGRSVSAAASVLVSEMPLLIGFKPDSDLNYLARGSSHGVALIAVDSQGMKAAAAGLKLARIESQFASVLTKQTNGTYKYESRKKELTLSEVPLKIAAAGVELPLTTAVPGTFAYLIRDASGLELNRIDYTVAGKGNVTRSLDRNAELQIALDKKDYAPGDDIELSIKAPYTGAGLITIERDHVYAAQWFKTDTTASVQRIHIPANFEGNGYVSVQFTRDLKSSEIFTSPLSFGVAPFMTSLAERTNPLELHTPELAKPGAEIHMKLSAAHPSRAVLFAVDEGILQVARYQAPDPLGEFFKKRALEVSTAQILDLILPEFKRVLAAAAPGGDADAALHRNLNPFKRKHDQPAVFWSGIVDLGNDHDFVWTVPDSFNGNLKIFAVAVDDATIGVAQASIVVRGDFVLTPNMPVAVAPGDEFEVSVGVANTIPDSATGDILVTAQASAAMTR